MTLSTRKAFPDLFLEDMLPELSNLIVDKFNSKQDKIPMVFNFHSTDKAIEQSDTLGTFPSAPEIPEGESVNYYTFKQGFDKTYTMVKYGLGMKTTEEMIEDEKYGLIAKLARSLGKSIFETRQIQAFNVFNNGFATAGPDGVSLFNTAHPKLGGGTSSNTATADLSVSSLENAIINFMNTTDDEGKRVGITPKILLIPPALMFTAREILNSVQKSGTANNNMNSLAEEGLTIVVCEYLTDTGAFFVLAEPDEHEIHFYERKAPKTEGGFDFDTGSGKTKMTTRFDVGFSDWPGAYGAT